MESKGVSDIIYNAWSCFIPGSPAYIWEQKLKRVKFALKQWATMHYQEPKIRKLELIKQMETLHGHMEQIEVTQELIIQEIELEKALQTTLRQEEESSRLQSRNLWLINGDQNTKLFQNQCKERQRRNTIRDLKKDDGNYTMDQVEIINEVRVFF